MTTEWRRPEGGIGLCGPGSEPQPDPFPHRKRPDLCASFDHPGSTYNPHMDKTWCLCGEIIRDGNHATHDDCCCGGRLIECLHIDTTEAVA